MTKEEELREIEASYNHYYFNCDDWSIEDIDLRLRIDYMYPKALTQDEAYNWISKLCYGDEETDGE